MNIRFGYVAMSKEVKNASPSKTMTMTGFQKLMDKDAALRKLERIAEENLQNTLRLLYHNRAYDIHVYRFSSRLIPLWGHELLKDWDPMPILQKSFEKIGETVKKDGLRVSFHPDHFTVLSTPRKDVLTNSIKDLSRHTQMLEAMGLGKEAKLNIHIGGTYSNKEKSMQRFLHQFDQIEPEVRQRITLENDDKTFTAKETLEACQELKVPMVLDLHHHKINNNGEKATELWTDIMKTWEGHQDLSVKIHVSSPKNEQNPRGHADEVEPEPLYQFFKKIAPNTEHLDVMIEAKNKDMALLALMEEMLHRDGVEQIDQSSIRI